MRTILLFLFGVWLVPKIIRFAFRVLFVFLVLVFVVLPALFQHYGS